MKIPFDDILSLDNGMLSSFHFRTPAIPLLSIEYSSLPLDINFSIHFDHLLIFENLIQFHYISDVLLNISSIPATLPYTGEELKIQIANLTEGASIEDIQLLIACQQCRLKTFTSKGIICQPPSQLLDCPLMNSSIAPIRFRIGFREYFLGYLSYISSSSFRYSLLTIILFSLSSCLFTIVSLLVILCIYRKLKKSNKTTSSLSSVKANDETDRVLWSTTTMTSAVGNGPYYQIYEQIPSLSSHQNTLRKSSVLLCPYHYHQENQATLLFKRHLRTISIDDQQLKKLLFTSNTYSISFSNRSHYSSNLRQSMELFYDLLLIDPFRQAFVQQLIQMNNEELYEYSSYIFRYDSSFFNVLPSTRRLDFNKFISTLFLQSKRNVIEIFDSFDKLIDELIDFLDCSPCDEILNRSMKSLSSSTLLIIPQFEYHSIELSINYDNLFHFYLSVFDCDTIDQISKKIIRHFHSMEDLIHQEIDLCLPMRNSRLCSHRIPMIKDYFIDSTIFCRKKQRKEKNDYSYHLIMENQLIDDAVLIEQRLKENQNAFQEIFKNFSEQILKSLPCLYVWRKQMKIDDPKHFFQLYVQLISDLLRKISRLMITRSTCPIIQSCLNVIADDFELISRMKTPFSSFQIPLNSMSNSVLLSSCHIRSLILEDDIAIQSLFELYRFYELYSEPVRFLCLFVVLNFSFLRRSINVLEKIMSVF